VRKISDVHYGLTTINPKHPLLRTSSSTPHLVHFAGIDTIPIFCTRDVAKWSDLHARVRAELLFKHTRRRPSSGVCGHGTTTCALTPMGTSTSNRNTSRLELPSSGCLDRVVLSRRQKDLTSPRSVWRLMFIAAGP
jgi:hypothetical protein